MADIRKEAVIDAATVPDGAPLPPSPSGEAETLAPAGEPLPAEQRPSVPGYEIHEELGRGGMGVVYKARQLSLNRFVALKMILAGPYAGAEQLARFRLEAEAVARLQHPGIVHIHEIGSQAGHAYLALEYVAGGTLTRKCAGRPLPADEAATLVEALARAVHYAHQQGIVHRDLKPGNVLLTEDGRPKITDFGLAKRLDAEPGATPSGPQTQSGAILGTPAYMAPEQAGGQRGKVGPPADVYALGAILYDLLTGRPPFQADNAVDVINKVMTEEPLPPRRIEPTCPPDLETVCLKCLRKDAAERYASAGELADDLGRFLAGEPTQARPPTTGERFRRWSWRRRWWLAGCGSVACLLLLLVVSLALNAASLFFLGTVRSEGGGPPTVTGTEAVVVPGAEEGQGGVAAKAAGKPDPVSPVSNNKKSAATRKALKTKVSFKWKDMPFGDVINEIKEEVKGFRIHVDIKGGVNNNKQITFECKDKPLEDVLGELLGKSGWGYYVNNKKDAYEGDVFIRTGEERGYRNGDTIYPYLLKSVAWVTTFKGDLWATGGTGTLIDRENRLVLTNYHVVHGLQDLVVFFPIYDGQNELIVERNLYAKRAKEVHTINGKIVAQDKTLDLALIQLDRVPFVIEALPIAEELPETGDEVQSVGNSGVSATLWVYTPGTVRSVYKKKWTDKKKWTAGTRDIVLTLNAKVIETSSQSNPGDSGGPCCNNRGELVGVTHGGISSGHDTISTFIACTEAEDFINKAFAEVLQLQGKKWVRSQRLLH